LRPLGDEGGVSGGEIRAKMPPERRGAVFLSGNRTAREFRDGNREPAHDFHIISISLILSMLSDYG
jgi:hypothetical protein